MSLVTVNWNPQRRQLRQFGAICVFVFGFLGVALYIRHVFFGLQMTPRTSHSIGVVLCMIGVACGIAAIVAPSLLRPIYLGLSAIGLPIGIVISHTVLAILFYGLLTPIGLLMRLLGRDTMQQALRPDLQTYWQARSPAPDVRRHFRQS